MARRTDVLRSRRYVSAIDDQPPVSMQAWAVVTTHLRDELTGAAPGVLSQLACDSAAFLPRVGPNGEAGLAAIPGRAMPLLAVSPYPVRLSVQATGYIDDARNVTIPSQPLFPGAFAPLDLGPWELHRQPVQLFGRVMLRQPLVPDTIVVGAKVTLTRLWFRRPTALAPGPDPLAILSVSTPCAWPRPASAAVAATTMLVTGGPFRLEREAGPGVRAILLSNTSGLAAGDVLAFDRGDPDHAEYVGVTSIDGTAGPTEPATVNLRFPLQRRHLRDLAVDAVTPQPPVATNTLGPAAIAGDRSLLLQSPITAIASGDVVEITGGTAAAEYHVASLLAAKSDSRGLFRLPPLARAFQVELTANDGVHSPVARLVVPEYGEAENRIDFLLN